MEKYLSPRNYLLSLWTSESSDPIDERRMSLKNVSL